MIVLDASALVELLLRTETGGAVASRIRPTEITLHAPELIDLEVAQALRRYARWGQIGERRAAQSLDLLADLDLTRYPHEPLLRRVWELRGNLTAYDAAYVALAEALACPLVTCDGRLAGGGGGIAPVEVI